MRSSIVAAAVACLVMSQPAYAADGDQEWFRRAITATAPTDADTHGSATRQVRRQAQVSISGLAHLDTETPKRAPSRGCVPAQLQSVLDDVEAKFGNVNVTSTCRTASANRAAGGAPQSLHLIGQAVDFRVNANPSAVQAYLAAHGDVGGLKHYGGGLFHIDTGARRPF